MKTNELMIGDLVKWKEQEGFTNEDRKTVMRVKRVLQGEIWIDGRYCSYNEVLFDPIPLTKQMLEVNGFKYEPNSEEEDGWWCWNRTGVNDGNEYINIAFCDDDVAVYDVELMKGSNSMTLHCNYVHELQHAIRLCGIDKEIRL